MPNVRVVRLVHSLFITEILISPEDRRGIVDSPEGTKVPRIGHRRGQEMKTIIRRSVVVAFLYAFFTTAAVAATAPKVTWTTDQGDLEIGQLRGKVVYLDFWASWCVPCRQSFPFMNELQEQYADEGFEVVAVNLDKERELVERFLARYPARFTIAYDPSGETAATFSVKGMPSTYLIDRNGEIRLSHVGFREKDRAELRARVRELLGD